MSLKKTQEALLLLKISNYIKTNRPLHYCYHTSCHECHSPWSKFGFDTLCTILEPYMMMAKGATGAHNKFDRGER